MESWREMLVAEMATHGETLGDIEASTLSDAEMDAQFDSGHGSTEGIPFTVWTARSVYFPVVYDGAEWVGRVSRHPDGRPTEHVGGG